MENKRKTPPLSTTTFKPFSIMWRNPHLSFPFPHISPPLIHSVYITILIEHQHDIPPFPLFPHHLLLFLFIFFSIYKERNIYKKEKTPSLPPVGGDQIQRPPLRKKRKQRRYPASPYRGIRGVLGIRGGLWSQ